MRSIARDRHHWVVQPLVDAGLDLEEIRVLVFRLGFDAIVGADQGTATDLMAPVSGRPVEVRAAWAETIDRLVALEVR